MHLHTIYYWSIVFAKRLLLNHHHQINAVLILRTSILLKYRIFYSPLRGSNKCPINPSNMSTFEAYYFRFVDWQMSLLCHETCRINTCRLSSDKLTPLYFCHCLLRLLSYKTGSFLSHHHLINAELPSRTRILLKYLLCLWPMRSINWSRLITQRSSFYKSRIHLTHLYPLSTYLPCDWFLWL